MIKVVLNLTLLLCAFVGVISIPIDNGVEGDPEIECGSTGVVISFNTKEPFAGRVYVKGHYEDPQCRSGAASPLRRTASLNVSFSECGTDRARSLQPRGMNVQQAIVISFHSQFLTKVDRAYAIQCFYMEADKTVSQDLQVSELSTLFQTENVPIPTCRYDILSEGPTGSPVKFASIGQPVFHKWTCETDHQADIFCMLVKACYVDDGSGNRVKLLDDDGCATDKYLLQNLEYSTDLIAGREAHVFKYADKAALLFACQISVMVREPAEQCPRPTCASNDTKKPGDIDEFFSVNNKAATKRPLPMKTVATPPVLNIRKPKLNASERNFRKYLYKREIRSDQYVGTWDVKALPISTFDLEYSGSKVDNESTQSGAVGRSRNSLCLSTPVAHFLYFVSLVSLLLLIITVCVLCRVGCCK